MEAVRTSDKGAALALLERCLGSKDLLNARIQNLDGVYSIEVSRPTYKVAKPDSARQGEAALPCYGKVEQ